MCLFSMINLFCLSCVNGHGLLERLQNYYVKKRLFKIQHDLGSWAMLLQSKWMPTNLAILIQRPDATQVNLISLLSEGLLKRL